jgi:glycosyltransferase involved in cell wall biosynthesis
MKTTKLILLISNRLKPILLKIFPHKLLRRLKKNMIRSSIDSLAATKVISFVPGKYEHGINLIGNIKAESGLGQSCRLVADELLASGIDFSIYSYSQLGNVKEAASKWDDKISSELPYSINLIHINPYEFGLAFAQLDSSVWDCRYNIAFWLWELEEFPEEWTPCFSCLDEIWTPSEFISKSIRKRTNLPIITIPYSVNVSIKQIYSRDYFHLPKDKFLFLVMYDSSSITERKNPKGTMDAFKRAFDKAQQDVGIIIKVNNAVKEDINLIKHEMNGYSNVYIIQDTLDKDCVNSLIKCSNVLVSLHRSEGFGLVLAEAMLLGIPTIATNWSSNIEFMNQEVSCLVDYKLIEIEKDMGPFKKGNRWADPDITEASHFMNKLYTDKSFYDLIALKAKLYINDKLSIQRAAESINKRVAEIMEKYGK